MPKWNIIPNHPLSSSKGLNFFWIQILILNYFQPPLKISLTSVMQFKKEQAKRCLWSQSTELECEETSVCQVRGSRPEWQHQSSKKISSSREVHFTLNPFLFLALPLPHVVSLFLSFHFPFSLSFSLHLSLFHFSSRQMVNHTMQFCSISRALSYHNSPIVIKSE